MSRAMLDNNQQSVAFSVTRSLNDNPTNSQLTVEQ